MHKYISAYLDQSHLTAIDEQVYTSGTGYRLSEACSWFTLVAGLALIWINRVMIHYGGTMDRAGEAGSNSQGVKISMSNADPAVISGDWKNSSGWM